MGELTTLLGQPQNLVSYHLRELRSAGLVSSRRSSFDGRDSYYRVDLPGCGEMLCAAAAALDPGLRLAPAPVPLPQAAEPKPAVLFLCTGNSARSQMAEALLEQLSGGAVGAMSAGSHPRELHPNAVRAMAARGIDIRGRAAKHFETMSGVQFERVVTLCDRVREVCPEFSGHYEAVHWSIPDPAAAGGTLEESYPAFEAVAADLEVRIRHLIAQMSVSEGERTSV